MKQQHPQYTLPELCKMLEVSTSGYHAHRHKPERPRRMQDAQLADTLQQDFAASRSTYGCLRLMHGLRKKGQRHGKNRIARLMRSQGLQVRQKRRFVPRTTLADSSATPSPNQLLERTAAPTRPDEVWLTDITCIPTGEGWLYLAAELDACSRRCLGWAVSHSMHASLVNASLQRARTTRGASPKTPGLPAIHHSDRGCQYTSKEHRTLLAQNGISQSMSRRANCHDNATMESFWATLKAECFGATVPDTRQHASTMIFDYIETFYNPTRLHSSLGYLSPLQFEQQLHNNKNQPNFSTAHFRR